MPSDFNKNELAALRQIKARIRVANERLEKLVAVSPPTATTVRSIAECRREIAAAKRQQAEITDTKNARKATRNETQADKLLIQIQEEFPPLAVEGSRTNWAKVLGGGEDTENDSEPSEPPPMLSAAELEDRKTRVLARLNSLGSEEKFKAARAYLTEQGILLRDALRRLREEEAEATRQEQAAQDNRDFVAGEADVEPLRTKFYARLAAGFLPLDVRENTRQTFLKLAEEAEHKQKQAVAMPPVDGVHPAAIFRARKYFYRDAAQRLAMFDSTQWDLNHEPALSTLDEEFWMSGKATCNANLAFRTKSEKALIVHVARKYFEWKQDFVRLAELPAFPAPIVIPDKPHIPLEELQRREQEKCLEALQPIHFDQINETIYTVETATHENPYSKPLLLWPDGREVQVGVEILYDRKAKRYRRFPTPAALEPNWSVGGQRYEYEQNECGDWVKVPISNGPKDSWIQNAEGHFVRDSSMPNGQWQRQPLLKLISGDHRPPEGDPRKFFSNGSWWDSEDIEKANGATFNIRLASLPETHVADQVATKRDDTTPILAEERLSPWRKWELQKSSA